MSYELAIQRLLEYQRLYTEVELTEEGMFLVDEIPSDYSGSFVARVELVFAVVSVDWGGRVRLQTYNPPEVQNQDRETGLPIVIDGEHTVRQGQSSPNVVLQWKENSFLDSRFRTIASTMWATMKYQIGEWTL